MNVELEQDPRLKIRLLETELEELKTIISLQNKQIAALCKWIMLGDFDNNLRSDFIDIDFLQGLDK